MVYNHCSMSMLTLLKGIIVGPSRTGYVCLHDWYSQSVENVLTTGLTSNTEPPLTT